MFSSCFLLSITTFVQESLVVSVTVVFKLIWFDLFKMYVNIVNVVSQTLYQEIFVKLVAKNLFPI